MSIPTDTFPKNARTSVYWQHLKSATRDGALKSRQNEKRAAEVAARRDVVLSRVPRLLRIVGAALQSRTVVVRVGVGILLLRAFLLLFGAGSEARFSWLIILHLAREHDVAQASLHAVELGG